MSDKPQTTRNKIQGFYTDENSQIIFIDTPGIHKPKHKLGDYMVRMATETLREVDIILYLIDATEKYGPGEEYIINKLKETSTPVFLIVNKIDEMTPEQVMQVIEKYRHLYDFAEIVPVSALKGNNVETMMQQLLEYMEEGPAYYPEDEITDHPERFIVSELIREKVLQLTRDEIPHSVAVIIGNERTKRRRCIYISCYCRRAFLRRKELSSETGRPVKENRRARPSGYSKTAWFQRVSGALCQSRKRLEKQLLPA